MQFYFQPSRKSGGSSTGSSAALSLPDEVRDRDEKLSVSMERYRLQCKHLGDSLEECEEKLASFEIQVRRLGILLPIWTNNNEDVIYYCRRIITWPTSERKYHP